jgi:hypothetical protein
MDTPFIYMHSDIPQGITIRQWRHERAPGKVQGGLIRTLIRVLVPEPRA